MVLEEQILKNEFFELVLGILELFLQPDLKSLMTLFPVVQRTLVVHGMIRHWILLIECL